MHLTSTTSTLQIYNGAVVLFSPDLATARTLYAPQIPVPPFPLHITLLTPHEYKRLDKPSLRSINIPSHQIYILGLGQTRNQQVQWLVVAWNHANKWRRKTGLEKKDFHVTLSARDDWEAKKGMRSLLGGGIDRAAVYEQLVALGEEGLDHANLTCEDQDMQQDLTRLAIQHFPDSYRGYIRVADGQALLNPKLALLCYARAGSLNPALLKTVIKKMLALRDTCSYGPLVNAEELATIPTDIAPSVLQPFSQQLDSDLSSHLWTFSASSSRKRQLYLGQHELPRFFTWLYPGRLAGMSTPRSEADIVLLKDMRITDVLTLTEESPLPPACFAFRSISNLFIPVINYQAPTLEEMDIIYQRIQDGGVWLIHCGGGKGRAGTVLACLIAMFGLGGPSFAAGEEGVTMPQMDAQTAISTLRAMRSGSLETSFQEKFVAQWVSHRWRTAHSAAQPIEEPWTELQQDVDRKSLPQGIHPGVAGMILLIGKPGSGKSWFSDSLLKRRARGRTIVISQDESGSRSACERQLSRSYTDDTLVILDRCNPESMDRKGWLSLIPTGKPVIAVYFDYEVELCRQRVDQRLDHPTIKPGRGGPAMRQMNTLMTAPTLAEGFAAILAISSFTAAREAVILLGGHPTITKFPRTTHLLNLGAITDDDLVNTEFREIHDVNLTLEEKIDGANMGFSLDYDGNLLVQNRSHYISYAEHAQFKPLKTWLERHENDLRKLLDRDAQFPERYILYGEWCVAQHSIAYKRLPDPFLAFDLFDRVTGTFLSRRVLATALSGTSVQQVPLIEERDFLTREHLVRLMARQSEFADGPIEGVYVRFEDAERRITRDRGKLVRGDFLVGDEHWSKGPLVYNGILKGQQET